MIPNVLPTFNFDLGDTAEEHQAHRSGNGGSFLAGTAIGIGHENVAATSCPATRSRLEKGHLRWLWAIIAFVLLRPFPFGVGELVRLRESPTEVVVNFRIVGLKARGFLVVGDGLGQALLAHECVREIVLRFGVIGFEPEGGFVMRNRFRDAIESDQSLAEAVVGFGRIGIELERARKFAHGFGIAARNG